MAAEMQHHLDERTDDNVADGFSPDAARRAALRKFGNVGLLQEKTRDELTWLWLEQLLQDLRFAVRALRRSPGFTIFALLTLALGIGANTAIFSVVNSVLLRPLPVSRPGELVFLTDPDDAGLRGGLRTGTRDFLSYPEFQHLRENSQAFSGLLAVSASRLGGVVHVVNPGQADSQGPAHISLVSGNYFSVLGVRPFLGRVFTEEMDRRRDADPVAVISHAFWQNRMSGDPAAIGRIIRVRDTVCMVIGVMPKNFFGETTGLPTGVWLPIAMQGQIMPGRDLLSPSANPLGNFRWLTVIGRRKPEVSTAQAQANVDFVFRQYLQSQFGALPPAQLAAVPQKRRQQFFDQRIVVTDGSRGASTLRKGYTKPLVVLLSLVGVLLLSACANLANLTLARAARRQKEIALRVALGAKSSRVFRQLLAESLLVSVIGGACGLCLAYWGDSLLLRLVTGNASGVSTDTRVLLFAFGVSLLVGVIFGTAPALRAWRVDLNAVLKDTVDAGTRARSFPVGKALVVVQVALSLPLLFVAGLFVHSFQKLAAVDLGYDQSRLLLIQPDTTGYRDATLSQLYRDLNDRLRSLPGVQGVTLSANGLFTGRETSHRIAIDGYVPQPNQNMSPSFDHIAANYCSTVGIPVLRGREIGPDDGRGQRVALINQTMAREYFGEENPLGRNITVNVSSGPNASTPYSFVVVGVVGDAKYSSVREKPRPHYYVPLENPIGPPNAGYVTAPVCIVHTAGDPSGLSADIRAVMKQLSPNSQPPTITTVEQQIARTLGLDRALTGFSGFFGAVATVLVSLGIYGIMAYTVTRRTREIGIRIAIGAQGSSVLSLIVGESLILVLCGVGIGIPVAIGTGRFVTTFLFGLSPLDPLVLITTVGGMFVVGAAAAYFPARSAMRVSPMIALRSD